MAAIFSWILEDVIPYELAEKLGTPAVDQVLQILANSMLVVTTFSLSTMVAAYSAATTNATPRSTQLLLEDPTAQNALSVFIGSFLFSLVSIIFLKANVYSDSGRVILLGTTVMVIIMIVVVLLRWITHLSKLGRVGHTISMVEAAVRRAIEAWWKRPALGGIAMTSAYEPMPAHEALFHPEVGFIRHIDMQALQEQCNTHHLTLYLIRLPGSFNDAAHPLLYTSQKASEEQIEEIRNCFTIGEKRTFQQDPRLG